MSSAWGSSWGKAWGNAWGLISQAVTGAAGKKKRKSVLVHPKKVIVEVDGKTYRLDEDELEAFLRDKFAAVEPKFKRIAKGQPIASIRKQEAPQIELVQADPQVMTEVHQQIVEMNRLMERLWLNLLRREEMEREDEEILLLVA